MSSAQVSTGLSSAYAGSSASALPASSVVEHDEVVYGDPKPQPQPDPEPECCCKTINITLHFH